MGSREFTFCIGGFSLEGNDLIQMLYENDHDLFSCIHILQKLSIYSSYFNLDTTLYVW